MHKTMQTYRDTLHATLREANLTMTLLQDIPIFDGRESSKLEHCFMDIETAADILKESHTHLARAKSYGLTFTLICEALQTGKCWDEIKGTLGWSSVIQIVILTHHTLWRYNRRIMKLSLPMSTTSNSS